MIGLSHCTCVFLVTRPFILYHKFWPWSLTYFWKTLTLAITFKPEVIGLSYCTCVFIVTRPFTWYHNIWPCDFDLQVWPTCENFNLGCYLMIVAARRASLSSDNSYCTLPHGSVVEVGFNDIYHYLLMRSTDQSVHFHKYFISLSWSSDIQAELHDSCASLCICSLWACILMMLRRLSGASGRFESACKRPLVIHGMSASSRSKF